MQIKIKCPVCNANNTLSPVQQQCRRCKENLSLLYRIKGYSLKYRLLLIGWLKHEDKRNVAGIAQHAMNLKEVDKLG